MVYCVQHSGLLPISPLGRNNLSHHLQIRRKQFLEQASRPISYNGRVSWSGHCQSYSPTICPLFNQVLHPLCNLTRLYQDSAGIIPVLALHDALQKRCLYKSKSHSSDKLAISFFIEDLPGANSDNLDLSFGLGFGQTLDEPNCSMLACNVESRRKMAIDSRDGRRDDDDTFLVLSEACPDCNAAKFNRMSEVDVEFGVSLCLTIAPETRPFLGESDYG